MFLYLYFQHTLSFINFGNVQTQPVYKNEQLLLIHNSSTPCAGNSKLNYSSIVNFHCDKNVMVCF